MVATDDVISITACVWASKRSAWPNVSVVFCIFVFFCAQVSYCDCLSKLVVMSQNLSRSYVCSQISTQTPFCTVKLKQGRKTHFWRLQTVTVREQSVPTLNAINTETSKVEEREEEWRRVRLLCAASQGKVFVEEVLAGAPGCEGDSDWWRRRWFAIWASGDLLLCDHRDAGTTFRRKKRDEPKKFLNRAYGEM